MDAKYRLFKPGMTVVDLVCAFSLYLYYALPNLRTGLRTR